MKKLTLKVLLTSFILFSQPVNAGIVDDLKMKARPHLVKILGEDLTIKLLGRDPNAVKMPAIPKISSDATNEGLIGTKSKSEIEFTEELNRKYNYAFVKEVVKAVQEKDATDSDFGKWMNTLEQGGSRSGVYRALVLGPRYARLEREPYSPNRKVVDFTMLILKKYLDKDISRDKIMGANFYTVKRNITEKTLEVVDALFLQKGDEIYDWYGILSQELAEKYQVGLNNKIRKDTLAFKHKVWAKNVPDEYLRSEVIIKLHNIYNALQVR